MSRRSKKSNQIKSNQIKSNQIKDYADYLNKSTDAANTNNWILVYLSNGEPDEASISKDLLEVYEEANNYIRFTFYDLNTLLTDCLPYIESNKIKVFVEELIEYIRIEINGELDMTITNDTANLIIASELSFDAAFNIDKSMKEAKFQLLMKLKEQMKDVLSKIAQNYELTCNIDNKFNKWGGFSIKHKTIQNNVHVRFEFHKNDLNEFHWGLKTNNKNDYNLKINATDWQEYFDILDKEHHGKGKPTLAWPWSCCAFDIAINDASIPSIEEQKINWNSSSKVWQWIIKDDTFAKQLVSLAVQTTELLNKAKGSHK